MDGHGPREIEERLRAAQFQVEITGHPRESQIGMFLAKRIAADMA